MEGNFDIETFMTDPKALQIATVIPRNGASMETVLATLKELGVESITETGENELTIHADISILNQPQKVCIITFKTAMMIRATQYRSK